MLFSVKGIEPRIDTVAEVVFRVPGLPGIHLNAVQRVGFNWMSSGFGELDKPELVALKHVR